MAAVRGLRVSVKVGGGGGGTEPEPMEVEEGELQAAQVAGLPQAAPVQDTPLEIVPEAIEKKEQRAKRFHFRAEVKDDQRNVVLDRETMRKDRHEDSSGDETEEGEVEEDHPSDAEVETEKKVESTLDTLSQAEEDSLLQNDPRRSLDLIKGNQLYMRFATKDDKKELGAARRSQYYMKYGNPNYGGMKGILSNSWKKRYHSRRTQRDVTKKQTFIGDDVGIAPAYKHLHSGLVNVPEEPIEEEEEEEDMDEDDRVVVEYRDELQAFKRDREGARRSAVSTSDSDEMDYDLELKMISTPSPKKSMKMTMYADEVESQLKTIRNSLKSEGNSTGSSVKNRIGSKSHADKPADVRLLLEEKRQNTASKQSGSVPKSGTRKNL
ncbi:hypothetical protein FKM82_008415 [Ascaphus truei]